jgi:hypothetical protein
VRQAALAAGIVKTNSALNDLSRAWGKASAEERAAFCNEAGLQSR